MGETPLQLACREGHVEVFRVLLEHGAKVEVRELSEGVRQGVLGHPTPRSGKRGPRGGVQGAARGERGGRLDGTEHASH